MKHLTITIALLLAAVTLTAQEAAPTADDLYRMDDYQGAIAAYEDILAGGKTSADLHYNLGNAYYRDGQLGKAILNYERALRLKPNMTDAKENLALANARTADRITTLPQMFIVRWWNSLTTAITPHGWAVSLLFLLLASALLISATRTYNAHPYAIITDQAVTLKASPDNKSIDKMILHEGTKVKILDDLTGWYKISIADGTNGWCQQNSMERI